MDALSEDARAQYTNLRLLQGRLAKGELLVDKELQDARKALATLEGATHDEQERLKIAIAQEFGRQEAQQKENGKSSQVRDKILQAEVISLKAQFAEQLKKQDTEWQRVLRHQEDRSAQLLNQQKANAAEQHQKDRQAARKLLDKQNHKIQNAIQALTDRIDDHEKPSFTIRPTEACDGGPGPSNQGQLILGLLRIILIPINDQLLLQGKIKEKELTVEKISNYLRHQVILVVIQTQTLVTMTTMTIKEEKMAGAEEADVQNTTLEDHRFLAIHPPYERHIRILATAQYTELINKKCG